jgi:hypothetical protein
LIPTEAELGTEITIDSRVTVGTDATGDPELLCGPPPPPHAHKSTFSASDTSARHFLGTKCRFILDPGQNFEDVRAFLALNGIKSEPRAPHLQG